MWPENAPIVRAFLAADTQWRVSAVAGLAGFRLFWIGLDYAGAHAGIEAAGIDITPELWAGVRVMETAALAVLNRDRR